MCACVLSVIISVLISVLSACGGIVVCVTIGVERAQLVAERCSTHSTHSTQANALSRSSIYSSSGHNNSRCAH